MVTTSTTVFPIGQNIFYYNKWKTFENKEIRNCFEQLSREEVDTLKYGDCVWQDQDPYYHHGKVYGFTFVQLTDVDKESWNYFKIKEGSENRLVELTKSENFSTEI